MEWNTDFYLNLSLFWDICIQLETRSFAVDGGRYTDTLKPVYLKLS